METELDAYQRRIETTVTAAGSRGILLDKTVFYPTGGGQLGDTGYLTFEDGRRIRIVDTRRDEHDPRLILHVTEQPLDTLRGTEVVAEIDWERRYRHMRMHTALHLLSAIVAAPVTGCSISAEKGRLDFDLPEPSFDRNEISERLSALVGNRIPVCARWVDAHELKTLRQFVRTRDVAPPNQGGRLRLIEIGSVDVQACGGTHVANTAEVGAVACVKIEKKSRHNRRVVIEFA